MTLHAALIIGALASVAALWSFAWFRCVASVRRHHDAVVRRLERFK